MRKAGDLLRLAAMAFTAQLESSLTLLVAVSAVSSHIAVEDCHRISIQSLVTHVVPPKSVFSVLPPWTSFRTQFQCPCRSIGRYCSVFSLITGRSKSTTSPWQDVAIQFLEFARDLSTTWQPLRSQRTCCSFHRRRCCGIQPSPQRQLRMRLH